MERNQSYYQCQESNNLKGSLSLNITKILNLMANPFSRKAIMNIIWNVLQDFLWDIKGVNTFKKTSQTILQIVPPRQMSVITSKI